LEQWEFVALSLICLGSADLQTVPVGLLPWTAAGWGLLWQTDQLTHLPGSRAWISLLNLALSQFNQAFFHCSWLHC